MSSYSVNTERLAKNTLALYFRMFFTMLVSLYTSRAILSALGEIDYGVYNVVGGVVTIFSLVTGSLSRAVSRFQTFELGKGNTERLKETFAMSMKIQILLSIIIVVLVEIIGVWFLNSQMKIPEERMFAANVVLQLSLISMVSYLLVVPYDSSVVAHEHFGIYTAVSIVEAMCKLLVAIFLSYSSVPADKLIWYASLMTATSIGIQFYFRAYCRKHFEECHIRWGKTNPSIFKEMIGFASWNVIGTSVSLLNGQGISIILNLIFGPVINTARGLAETVRNVVCSFVNNFTIALNPQITKAYAKGEVSYLKTLIYRGTRFSFYAMLVVSVPLLLETQFVLDLWLVEYPEHTVNFVRLTLLLSLVDVFSVSIHPAQEATGEVKRYQLVLGLLSLGSFALSSILLKLGAKPESCYYVAILVAISSLVARLEIIQRYIPLSIIEFCKNVVFNICKVGVLSLIIPVFLRLVMPNGWLRFVLVCALCVTCSVSVVLFIGCDTDERLFLIKLIKKVFRLE